MSQIFFVEIEESQYVKREILESLKDNIGLLERYEKFKAIREEKIKSIEQVREKIKDLNKIIADLKAKMPSSEKRAKHAEEKVKKVKVKKEVKKESSKKISKKTKKEIDALEDELSAIEAKLSRLG